MGAIAGLFHPATPKPVEAARVRAMAAAMAHRGPDGAGEWTAPGVGFAHRRLAVVGGAGAVQPVATPDLRYAAMLDGTILNHVALRDELRALGHRFAGEGDAEVVLHGFAAWGPALLDRLEGGFAIAVHDAAMQTLFLARDRLGAKPLHLAMLPDGALVFASELKGVLAHPLMRRAADARAVADFLALGHVPDDGCVVAGVEKLPAGHFVLVERGRPLRGARRWWSLRDTAESAPAALLPEMRGAVARTAGDNATALLLGGPGDAAVVALLAEASAKAVRTAGTGAEVAARFATAHRDVSGAVPGKVPGGDVAMLLDDMVATFDEPFGDPAAIDALVVARESGAVALSGIGAGLLLDGGRWRGFARREAWRRRGWPWLRSAGDDLAAAIGALPEAAWRGVASGVPDGHDPLSRYARAGDPIDAARRAEVAVRLPAQVLTMTDRVGMAAGVEWRAPFADPRLVGFALGLRARRVSLLAGAMAAYLPAMPVEAPAPPVAVWLRGPLAADMAGLARSRMLAELGWFDLPRLAAVADAHRAGQADHGVLLWRMLVLERSLTRLFG
ncbi:asparagine synthase (glutamine-hydrolyzing) [Sphingomonas sp. BE138]|uniref:asparagine synthetase B family protein n=1 Tax=Sphingomonas sp. BE138 TaxID=2817845 RepID=UPI00285F6A8D|nr:asparagine synthase-related protein [Sphingomonas sp. BE138]MDR6787098.1 asparagine synthase (glutamine-hydrolyzing) [Sphingomonas sp. BE138]